MRDPRDAARRVRLPDGVRWAMEILAAAVVLSAGGGAVQALQTAPPDAPRSAPPEPGGGDASPTPVAGIGGRGDSGMATRALSDSHPFNATTWGMFADSAGQRICSTPAAEPVPMDLQTATGNVRRFLDDGAGSGAIDAFDRSPEASSVAKATTAATAALVDGNEAGALAALLAAARLEPDDPRHLVNVAGLLPAFGLSSEALAFLAAADGMGAPVGTPFGIDQRAVFLNNEGRALLGLERWGEAAGLLRQAVELDPNLSEASTNLSLAVLCQGDRDEALRLARAGRYRMPVRLTERDGVSTPELEDAFDLSLGVDGRDSLIPSVQLPATPAEGVALRAYFAAWKEELLQRMLDRAQRQTEIQTQDPSTRVADLTLLRRGDIQLAISSLSAEGGRTADLWADVVASSDLAFGVWDAHFGPAGTVETISNGCGNSSDYQGCMQGECIPATDLAHVEWFAATNDLNTALRRWADAYYPLATAIAAHLGDQAQYDLAMLQIQEALDNGLLDLVSRAEEFTMFEDTNQDTCVTAPDPPTDASPQAADGPAGSPCPVEAGRFAIEVAFVSISVDCSEWSVEAATPGAIGVFAQITGSTQGETTVIVGPKASLGVGPLEASTNAGFYVTVSESTGVRDFGYRVEPGSLSAGVGPVSVTAASAESMDFSFVGISAYLPSF